ncbi:hypothetical protein [Metabacillus fastidiosus]|uniref:hypothetical protein n=1 Tax=Metabacillus fastidiosus TaxID=1458 RepID=UPI003D292CD6
MKAIKIILSIIIIFIIAACNTNQTETAPIKENELTVKAESNNVGNGEEYQYEITSVNGNGEINGVALNKISSDNAGIFLYQSELDFDVKAGDKIAVVWGSEEDEFKSIKKLD